MSKQVNRSRAHVSSGTPPGRALRPRDAASSRRSGRQRRLFGAAILTPALVVVVAALGMSGSRAPLRADAGTQQGSSQPGERTEFIGRAACTECHAEEARRWEGSHHDLALQEANERTVLGDFDGVTFAYAGVTSSFHARDGKYLVRTDGPDGAIQEYEVAYALGVDPLQQYLVAMPSGRLQVLPFAWDARPRARGGERWFHLYPDDNVTHEDVLHWTQPSQNWNAQCARCHSTNLHKGYVSGEDRYVTTWSEIDVSCEACHGPGSTHVARAREGSSPEQVRGALTVRSSAPGGWSFDGENPIARRSGARPGTQEIEMCAPCHSRRAEISSAALPGRPLLDDYVPALLTEDLYFPDGQIDGEVYEYGSFMQSEMHRAGVVCSDCHDPHTLRLRAEGNALCGRCHLSSHFDTPQHHFHPSASSGARCVACHMPSRTYMGVDERHDHSLRVPRPDLSAKLGTPDPCTSCHSERTPAWAAEVVAQRFPGGRADQSHYGEAIAAARKASGDAGPALIGVVEDSRMPAIVRATAVSLLRGFPSPRAEVVLREAVEDPDPQIRLAALEAASRVGSSTDLELPLVRLNDGRRAVRLAAASALLALPDAAISTAQRAELARAIEEYRSVQVANADRPQSHLNLSLLAMARGRNADAERELRTAMKIDRHFVPAYVNLADLLRVERRDHEGEQLLRQALARQPESAHAHHALGLLLVRSRRTMEALVELERATELAPETARYAYVLGIALHSSGYSDRALDVLRAAHGRRPADFDVLLGLATITRDAGDQDAARLYTKALREHSR